MPFRHATNIRHSYRFTLALLVLAAVSADAQCVDYRGFGHVQGRAVVGDRAWDMVTDATHAYVATYYDGLTVLDHTDPKHPVAVATLDLQTGVFAVDKAGDFLYMGGRYGADPGLHVVDVSDPLQPVRVGGMSVGDGVNKVATYGTYVLAQSATLDSLYLVDVADPLVLARVSVIPVHSDGLFVAGNLVYVTDGALLSIWDLSDPLAPVVRGTLSLPSFATGMDLTGSHLLVANYTSSPYGVEVIDVTDPDAPLAAGFITTHYTANDVHVAGDLAYVALSSGSIDLIDITDLAAPVLLGSLVGSAGDCMVVDGDRLFGSYSTDFSIFDVSGAAAPYPVVGSYNWGWGFSYGAVRSGDHVYVGSDLGVQIFDVTDPAAPVSLGGNILNRASVALVDGLLYAADTDGLEVFDLAVPAAPASLISLPMPWWPVDAQIAAADGLLFAGIRDSLVVFDVSVSSAPVRLSSRAMDVNTFELADGLVYVLSDTALHVVDPSDPVQLPELGRTTQWNCEDLAVTGGYAYSSNHTLGDGILQVFDVRDPAQPILAYWLNNVFALGLSVHGDQLLLSQGGWGVQLMDVGDPLNPVYSGHLYRPYETGWTYRANVIGDLVYLGSDEGVNFLPAPCTAVSAVRDERNLLRAGFGLAAYPNPFNPRVTIRFELPRALAVDAAVYDLRGRRVRRLLTRTLFESGSRAVVWAGEDDQGQAVASGVYFVRVSAAGVDATQKVMLVR